MRSWQFVADMEIGKFLILTGVILMTLGILLIFNPFGLGRLPGDLVVKRGSFTFYFPLATSVIISIVLTVLFWLLNRR